MNKEIERKWMVDPTFFSGDSMAPAMDRVHPHECEATFTHQKSEKMVQVYLTKEAKADIVTRLRYIEPFDNPESSIAMTSKVPTQDWPIEHEFELFRGMVGFNQMKSIMDSHIKAEYPYISKVRRTYCYYVRIGDCPAPQEIKVEYDFFDFPYKGLVIAEIEFNSDKEAKEFPKELETFLGFTEELTGDKKFSNIAMARMVVG